MVVLEGISSLAQFLHLLDHGLDALLGLLTAGHLAPELFLCETSRLSEGLSETLLRRELMDTTLVVFLKLLIGFFHELFHLGVELLHLGISLILGLSDHFVDLSHLVLIPLDLGLRVVTTSLKEGALIQHLVILVDKGLGLRDCKVIELVLVVSALLFEGLAGVFLLPLHALELCKVLAIWQVPLEAILGAAIVGEVLGDVFNVELPLLLQIVALLEAGADLSFVFLVVSSDLALALLVDLNFKATLSWPLLSEILIKLVNTLIT